MARPRKNNPTTTIGSVPWELKSRLRKFARKTKTTKTGDNYEKDSLVLDRIITFYETNEHPFLTQDAAHDTYPHRKVSQDVSQPNYTSSVSTSS